MFSFCEDGFRNELVINMYNRQINKSGQEIIEYGHRFDSIKFLIKGKVDLLTYDGQTFFQMEPGCVFGDFQIIFGLAANMIYRT